MTLRQYFLSFLVLSTLQHFILARPFPVGYFKCLTTETLGMDLLFWLPSRGAEPTRDSLQHEPAFWKSLKVSWVLRTSFLLFKLSPLLLVGSAPCLLPQIVPTLEAIAGRRDAPALASLFPGPVHGNWCLGDSGWGACAGDTAVYFPWAVWFLSPWFYSLLMTFSKVL